MSNGSYINSYIDILYKNNICDIIRDYAITYPNQIDAILTLDGLSEYFERGNSEEKEIMTWVVEKFGEQCSGTKELY